VTFALVRLSLSGMNHQAKWLLLVPKFAISKSGIESLLRSASLVDNVVFAEKAAIICAKRCDFEVAPKVYHTSKELFKRE
jgi:hypothetical protein